jgi:hypothetical protein
MDLIDQQEFLLYKPVSNRSELLSILILNMT